MGEFRHGWRVVVGAALGAGLGIAGLLTYNMGLFAEGLSRDLGLSRTGYGVAFFGATLALAIAMPLVGRAVDRFGARTTAAFGALALALGFVALSRVESVAAYGVVLVLIGLFAASSAPVPHTRAVAGAFARSRGLALGLTQVGIGLSAALVPPIVAVQVAHHGWRSGFLILAGLAAVAIIPILFGLPGRSATQADDSREDATAFTAVRKSRAYLLQLAAFTIMALAFAGLLSHFVPLLREAGVSIEQAGAFAGMIGLSVICTRVVVGWLADRMEPAWLGAASCVACAAGCLALALGGADLAPVAAVALGAAMGAEADLLGILTARNFPMAAYSRAYALQYAAFGVAGGVSPVWIGYLADVTGGYDAALFASAAGLFIPVALFCFLPGTIRRD
ncbi:MAG TPA: MFS transporter [Croceibacterium sp.]|nr:MFS transporter [Croceibacterium sp.]